MEKSSWVATLSAPLLRSFSGWTTRLDVVIAAHGRGLAHRPGVEGDKQAGRLLNLVRASLGAQPEGAAARAV
jgi:hypothetical protein